MKTRMLLVAMLVLLSLPVSAQAVDWSQVDMEAIRENVACPLDEAAEVKVPIRPDNRLLTALDLEACGTPEARELALKILRSILYECGNGNQVRAGGKNVCPPESIVRGELERIDGKAENAASTPSGPTASKSIEQPPQDAGAPKQRESAPKKAVPTQQRPR